MLVPFWRISYSHPIEAIPMEVRGFMGKMMSSAATLASRDRASLDKSAEPLIPSC
jgi:hypothetical protein